MLQDKSKQNKTSSSSSSVSLSLGTFESQQLDDFLIRNVVGDSPEIPEGLLYQGSESRKHECSASSEYSWRYEAVEAFNGIIGSTGDCWICSDSNVPNPNGSCYIQFNFDESKKILAFQMCRRGDSNCENFPKEMRLLGSQNGKFEGEEVVLGIFQNSDVTYGDWSIWQNIQNNIWCISLRIEIHSMWESSTDFGWVAVSEVQFIISEESSFSSSSSTSKSSSSSFRSSSSKSSSSSFSFSISSSSSSISKSSSSSSSFSVSISSSSSSWARDVGADYHAFTKDFVNDYFLTQYHIEGVRSTVISQMQQMVAQGATLASTRIWLVSPPGVQQENWRYHFPPSAQEIDNVRQYVLDAQSIGLRLYLGLCWLGCANFSTGSPDTTIGDCGYTAGEFLDKSHFSIESILNAVKDIKFLDGKPVVERFYLVPEVLAAANDFDGAVPFEKKNIRWFLSQLWQWFYNIVNVTGIIPTLYFIHDSQESHILNDSYVDANYPALNGHPSMFWMYRSLKFLKDNVLPIPDRIDFSSYHRLENPGTKYIDTVSRVIADYKAVIPDLLGVALKPLQIAETFYFGSQLSAFYNYYTDPDFEGVTFWTTPFHTGESTIEPPFNFTPLLGSLSSSSYSSSSKSSTSAVSTSSSSKSNVSSSSSSSVSEGHTLFLNTCQSRKIIKTQSTGPDSESYSCQGLPSVKIEPTHVCDLTVEHNYQDNAFFSTGYYSRVFQNQQHRMLNRTSGFLHDLYAIGPSFDNASLRCFAVLANNNPGTGIDDHCDMDVITYSCKIIGTNKASYFNFAEGQITVQESAGGGSSGYGQHKILVHNSAYTNWVHHGMVMTVLRDDPKLNYHLFRAKSGLLFRGKWESLLSVEKVDSCFGDGYVYAPKTDISFSAIDLSGAQWGNEASAIRLDDYGPGSKISWENGATLEHDTNGLNIKNSDSLSFGITPTSIKIPTNHKFILDGDASENTYMVYNGSYVLLYVNGIEKAAW